MALDISWPSLQSIALQVHCIVHTSVESLESNTPIKIVVAF